jgi:hypothetical protein
LTVKADFRIVWNTAVSVVLRVSQRHLDGDECLSIRLTFLPAENAHQISAAILTLESFSIFCKLSVLVPHGEFEYHRLNTPICVGAPTSTSSAPTGRAGFMMAWRERTPYAKDDDYVFPSFRLKGKKPLSASIMVQKYLRPAAVKAGVIKEDQRVRFGFHNFRHSLASSLVKLKCDPKTVQGILRHEDVRTTMQLYAQSDQESRLEAQGKFLALLLGDKAHLLTEKIQ